MVFWLFKSAWYATSFVSKIPESGMLTILKIYLALYNKCLKLTL